MILVSSSSLTLPELTSRPSSGVASLSDCFFSSSSSSLLSTFSSSSASSTCCWPVVDKTFTCCQFSLGGLLGCSAIKWILVIVIADRDQLCRVDTVLIEILTTGRNEIRFDHINDLDLLLPSLRRHEDLSRDNE